MKIFEWFKLKRMKRKSKKFEFSKFLVVWALCITSICVGLSYLLALTDHDSVSDVTISVVTTCVAIAVGYEAKSFGEKNSRNKYGIQIEDELEEESEEDKEILG